VKRSLRARVELNLFDRVVETLGAQDEGDDICFAAPHVYVDNSLRETLPSDPELLSEKLDSARLLLQTHLSLGEPGP
jgi:hypothetical protein